MVTFSLLPFYRVYVRKATWLQIPNPALFSFSAFLLAFAVSCTGIFGFLYQFQPHILCVLTPKIIHIKPINNAVMQSVTMKTTMF